MMFGVRGKHFDFPFIQPYPWNDKQPDVFGSLLEVDDEGLAELDKYENVENMLYHRVKAIAYRADLHIAPPEEVWVYVGGPALIHKTIPEGIWSL